MADDNATIFSDSTTLVDPSQKRYRLQQDNPCNTIIFSPARRPLYSVETTFEGETLTTVRKLATDQQQATASAQEGEFVASLRWNDVLDDKVKVGDASPQRLRKILGIQWVNLANTANFKDAEGRKYQWQGYAPGMVLKLYNLENSANPVLVAAFHRSRPSLETGLREPAYLEIEPRGTQILDTIIWSFLFLEKNRRAGARTFDGA